MEEVNITFTKKQIIITLSAVAIVLLLVSIGIARVMGNNEDLAEETPVDPNAPVEIAQADLNPCGAGFIVEWEATGVELKPLCFQYTPIPPPTLVPVAPTPTPINVQALIQEALAALPTPAPIMIIQAPGTPAQALPDGTVPIVQPAPASPCPEDRIPDTTTGALLCLVPPPPPTPTLGPPTPTVRPTPRVRHVSSPNLSQLSVTDGGSSLLKITSLTLTFHSLSLSGTITDAPSKSPTTIQVWQSRFEEGKAECSSERPVAFLRPGNTNSVFTQQTSDYEWQFCRNDVYSAPTIDEIPWLFTTSWSYEERKRRLTTEPRIWDFVVTANLDQELVRELEYESPSYWRIIVFSGNSVIAYEIANR